MVVPTFHSITEAFYQMRVFNDVDNNLTDLKKHYALGVYGKLKFLFFCSASAVAVILLH